LYNRDQKKIISEEFVVALTPPGMPEDISKIGKLQAVFKVSKKIILN
jgi:hypothetical protein